MPWVSVLCIHFTMTVNAMVIPMSGLALVLAVVQLLLMTLAFQTIKYPVSQPLDPHQQQQCQQLFHPLQHHQQIKKHPQLLHQPFLKIPTATIQMLPAMNASVLMALASIQIQWVCVLCTQITLIVDAMNQMGGNA